MDWLLCFPATLKIVLAFVGILVAHRLGVALGVSILAHALLLTLWTGTGAQGLGHQVASFLAPKNYLLIVDIVLLIQFIEALKASGRITRTVEALKLRLRSRRLTLAGLPALVGLLPMPGGALFSAPLVASVDGEQRLTGRHKVAINYWFRHIWEYWWPLYPGVILAIRYSGLPIGLFLLIQLPFTLASIVGGRLFILRNLGSEEAASSGRGAASLSDLSATLGPVSLLVTISVLGSMALPRIGAAKASSNLLAMLVGLLLSCGWVLLGGERSLRRPLRLLASRMTMTLVVLVAGVQAFSAALQTPLPPPRETLVALMRDELLMLGIPLVPVMMLVPFVSGVVTGVAMGYVGASFPLVFALLGEHAPLNQVAATTALAYACGYVGMMLSPIHICFVVTGQYFKSSPLQSYRFLLGPVAVVVASALLLSAAYYKLL
jgi:integral membrane protein (TIGR00529 family)